MNISRTEAQMSCIMCAEIPILDIPATGIFATMLYCKLQDSTYQGTDNFLFLSGNWAKLQYQETVCSVTEYFCIAKHQQ